MTEDQARKLEVPIKWNSKANVCVYCGRVPETFYVVTGHDHTDASIRWCICREAGQYKDEITTLRQRVAELETERDRLSELCDKWNFECDDMREDNNRLANVANALKQQRDELLAALEKFLDDNNPEGFGCACEPGRLCGPCSEAKRQRPLYAAIASVKEKA